MYSSKFYSISNSLFLAESATFMWVQLDWPSCRTRSVRLRRCLIMMLICFLNQRFLVALTAQNATHMHQKHIHGTETVAPIKYLELYAYSHYCSKNPYMIL